MKYEHNLEYFKRADINLKSLWTSFSWTNLLNGLFVVVSEGWVHIFPDFVFLNDELGPFLSICSD